MLDPRDVVRSAYALRSMLSSVLAGQITRAQDTYGALVGQLRDEFLQRVEDRCRAQWAEAVRVDDVSTPRDLDRAA